MSDIIKLYNHIVLNYTNLPYSESTRLLKELELLSLAFYVKTITKDKRNLKTLKTIIKEELKEGL